MMTDATGTPIAHRTGHLAESCAFISTGASSGPFAVECALNGGETCMGKKHVPPCRSRQARHCSYARPHLCSLPTLRCAICRCRRLWFQGAQPWSPSRRRRHCESQVPSEAQGLSTCLHYRGGPCRPSWRGKCSIGLASTWPGLSPIPIDWRTKQPRQASARGGDVAPIFSTSRRRMGNSASP